LQNVYQRGDRVTFAVFGRARLHDAKHVEKIARHARRMEGVSFPTDAQGDEEIRRQ
jgi:hypothetical protein